MLSGLSGFAGAQFDLAPCRRFSRSYVIASTYRCGSTYLCAALWRTGCLGAPSEYFNHESEMPVMQSRLNACTSREYIARLLKCRTSQNGVFGVKTQFYHFKAAIRRYPTLLDELAPVSYLSIERRDRIAQAVSLAKAYQTRAWSSVQVEKKGPLFYSAEFIEACLKEIREQYGQWNAWFDASGVQPHRIFYEDLCGNEVQILREIMNFMRVERIQLNARAPVVERQSDAINIEWIRRFREDTADRAELEISR